MTQLAEVSGSDSCQACSTIPLWMCLNCLVSFCRKREEYMKNSKKVCTINVFLPSYMYDMFVMDGKTMAREKGK